MPDTDPRARYRTQHKSIGTITPSGNIVVERMTTAILEAFATTSVRRFGLVTPYAPAYASRIPPHFQAQGYACVAQAHAGLSDNLSYRR